jgi:hypothetical protein
VVTDVVVDVVVECVCPGLGVECVVQRIYCVCESGV